MKSWRRVLHRDGLMLVIDKPAGLPVHRGPKGGANLEASFDALRFGLPRPPVLAHRLDKDTSGCLVLGRHRKATASLGLLFKHGKIGKTYWTVVEGGPAEDEGTIDMPLGRLNAERGWWQKPDPEGQEGNHQLESDGAWRWPDLACHGTGDRTEPYNCGCIRRRPAGRFSAITFSATARVSASRSCICIPARSWCRSPGIRTLSAWWRRPRPTCTNASAPAAGTGNRVLVPLSSTSPACGKGHAEGAGEGFHLLAVSRLRRNPLPPTLSRKQAGEGAHRGRGGD